MQAAHDRFRADLVSRLGLLYSAVVDADTTALITDGNQEGVAVGDGGCDRKLAEIFERKIQAKLGVPGSLIACPPTCATRSRT